MLFSATPNPLSFEIPTTRSNPGGDRIWHIDLFNQFAARIGGGIKPEPGFRKELAYPLHIRQIARGGSGRSRRHSRSSSNCRSTDRNPAFLHFRAVHHAVPAAEAEPLEYLAQETAALLRLILFAGGYFIIGHDDHTGVLENICRAESSGGGIEETLSISAWGCI